MAESKQVLAITSRLGDTEALLATATCQPPGGIEARPFKVIVTDRRLMVVRLDALLARTVKETILDVPLGDIAWVETRKRRPLALLGIAMFQVTVTLRNGETHGFDAVGLRVPKCRDMSAVLEHIAGFQPGPQVAPGWYPRDANPGTMVWWDGSIWLDPDKDLPPDEQGILRSLRFVAVLLVMQACVALLFGYFLVPFALRRTGRRARDILMLFIPVWGVIVWVQTFWRLSARRISWSPRTDLPSRPLFGPAVCPSIAFPPGTG